MPPMWDPAEKDQGPYDKVHVHGRGVVSVAFTPPTEEQLLAFKETRAYKRLRQLREEHNGQSRPQGEEVG